MPEEMRAALNLFFTLRRYKMKRRKSSKKFGHLKKINGLLFFRFDNCGPFEGGPGTVSNAFLLIITLLGSSSKYRKCYVTVEKL